MKIRVLDGDESKEVDIYSEEGLSLVARLWERVSFHNRLVYEPTWLGIPIIQLSSDIVMMQELLWKVRPDVVIETGVAHGGSLMLSASILELLGNGKVIGVDIDIRKPNEAAIRKHPLSKRIELIQGSSTSEDTVRVVQNGVKKSDKVLVILDSNHSYGHVLKELEIYSRFVSRGSYMVVMDGIQEMLTSNPTGKKEWKDDNPMRAIRDFLRGRSGWEVDRTYNRLKTTYCPDGFLKKL
ncbi:MAG: class I SAM-dependent methyltransferase [Candidatus Omnitrophica bacterium]|nr:class I SAM-dependent methyltransferase [Candidatus Omnitrophota bacterium]